MSRELLRLEGVSVASDAFTDGIEEITLAVDAGEIAAITSLDMSVSKSTVLQAAAGLLPPQSGRVLFEGRDVYSLDFRAEQRFRARCSHVPEGGALLENLTARDNVSLPLRYHRKPEESELRPLVERLLALTGFRESPDAFPRQLSSRGRRLASFARALIRGPRLVLVDTFFEGLELPDWRRLFEVILELNRSKQVAWLLVCDLDPAIFQVAERVAVLEGGRLLAYGHRQELYQVARIEEAFRQAEGTAQLRRSARMGRMRQRRGIPLPGETPSHSGTFPVMVEGYRIQAEPDILDPPQRPEESDPLEVSTPAATNPDSDLDRTLTIDGWVGLIPLGEGQDPDEPPVSE